MTSQSNDWIRSAQDEINQSIKVLFDPYPNSLLKDVMRYGVLNGGKRIRGLIVKAIGSAFKEKDEILNQLATSIELIHAYSLIHDDLPAMDDDYLRRGLPTCHVKFDEAQAILAGDGLQSLALEILSSSNFNIDPKNKLNIIHFLTKAIGFEGMVLGQSQDMVYTNQQIDPQKLAEMHSLKTGRLFEAACVCPALISNDINDKKIHDIKKIGRLIGIMYQITDDILDVTKTSSQLGKTSGKDAETNKQTYVTLYGLAESKKINNKNYQELKEITLQNSENFQNLFFLIDYIFERKY